MTQAKSLESRIETRIRRSKDCAFMPTDFLDLSTRNQIHKALRKLIEQDILIRIGHGVYAKAKISSLTHKVTPVSNLRSIAVDILRKIGVQVLSTQFEQDYKNGKSTQIPTGLVIGVDRQVNRKIGFNGRFVKFEKIYT